MKNSKECRLNSNVWEFFFPQVQTPKSNFFIYIVPWQQVQFPLSTEYGASSATWISPLKSCFLLPFTNQNTIKLKTNNLFLAANMGHSPECASPKPVSHTSPDQKELAPHILSIRGFFAPPLERSLPPNNPLFWHYPATQNQSKCYGNGPKQKVK